MSQTCAVAVSGLAYNKDGVAGSGSASADNGLGATVTPSTPGYQNPLIIYTPGGPQQIGTGYGGSATSTKYEVRDGGAAVTITCTPAVSVNVNSGTVDVSVNYSVNLSPVLLTLGGVTVDIADSYRRKVLTGQSIIASLTVGIGTIRSGSYIWLVDDYDAIFGEWNQNNGDLTEFPVLYDNKCSFYTKKSAPINVTCAAIIDFPDGTSDSVSGERLLESVKPVATWNVDSTGVRFNIDPPDGPVPATSFGAYDINPTRLGQYWSVTFATDAPFSGGRGSFLQLGTFSRYEYILNATSVPYRWKAPNDGEVLDTGFPYSIPDYPSTFLADPTVSGHSGDAPRSRTLSSAAKEVASDSFRTWLMYRPPVISGYTVRWVPIQKYTWSWSGTATQGVSGNSGTGIWTLSNKAGAAATVREITYDFPSPWSIVQTGQINYVPDDVYDPNAPP